ncbi:MAG: phage protein Gp36 family protein [Sulfitobacter sp.]
MSNLITIDELLDHIDQGELSQVAGIGSHNSSEGRALDTDKIDAAIKFASDMVRGYMLRRFPVISTLQAEQSPELIKGYVADIVRHRLRSRTGNRNTTSDETTQRFEDARTWLKEVSRGLINVDFGEEPVGSANTTNPMGTVRSVTPDKRASKILNGYH